MALSEKKLLHLVKLLKNAFAHQEAGQMQKAEFIYESILQEQSQHPEELHVLGFMAHQAGNSEIAVKLIEKAITRNPNVPDYYNNCGGVYRSLHKNVLAIKCYKRAIALKPDFAEAYNNMGNALKDMGRKNDAIARFEQAIALKPDFAEAYNNMGNALKDMGREDDAISSYEQAIALKPDYAEAHNNLGLTLDEAEKQEDAISHYERALAIKPDYINANYNLGNALLKLDQLDDAITYFNKALILKQDFAGALNNLGTTFKKLGRTDDAIANYEQAIVIEPKFAEAHYNLGLIYLLTGNFEQGWKEYEWRYETEQNNDYKRNFPQPLWDGRSLEGKTILIYEEQGYGDTFQFIRYIPMVAEAGGKILFECNKKLIHLFSNYKDIVQFTGKGGVLPKFDVHIPLLSLPDIFNTTLHTIPSVPEYIHASEDLVQTWKDRLLEHMKFKVGISWQGNKNYRDDRNRSINLNYFSELLSINNVDFISLQKGEGQEQIIENGLANLITDFTSEIDNEEKFADTAAIIKNLDLVISSDTSVVHLAGALGKQVWVLLPYSPDWRWLLNRDDSPWYPSMRLFRQPEKGDWESVIKEVINALKSLISDSDNIKIFSEIYENNKWGNNENASYKGSSGAGSSIKFNIVTYVPFLREFITKNKIKSVVDLGCGDWQCSNLIYEGMDINYQGYDAYKDICERNQKEYPQYKFNHIDFINDKEKLEEADLCILKDVLQHLCNRDINNLLDYLIKEKKYKNILIINCCDQINDNDDINIQEIKAGMLRQLSAKKLPLKKYNPKILMNYHTKEVSLISIK